MIFLYQFQVKSLPDKAKIEHTDRIFQSGS